MVEDRQAEGAGDERRLEAWARERARAAFADFLARREGGDLDEDAWLAGFDEAVRGELRAMLDDYERLSREYRGHAFALVAGARLGPFELVREVGRGGMGVVWEALQDFPRRRVALKLLYPHLSLLPSALERFERESSVAAVLAGEHIVRVHQVGVHEDLRWIAMELVEGGLTLADHIADLRRRAPPPDHARRMAALGRDMALALRQAHEKGVLHRDVKPGNILLAPGFRPKLADFGLAREDGGAHITRAGELLGTPMYASPEQLHGAKALDARSDLYSLGATLYEALTLERPHAVGDEGELARRVLEDDLPDPRRLRPSLPRDLVLVVRKLGALDPEARYPDAGAAAEDLQRFLDGQPVLARAPSASERAARWVRKHATAAGLALVLSGSSALLVLLADRAEAASRRAVEAKVLLRSLVDLQDPRAAEGAPPGPEDLARELLAAAEAQRGDDRARAARLCLAAGRSWRMAGSLRDAADSMRLAVQLAGSDPALRLEAGEELVRALAELDDHDASRPLLAELIELSKRVDASPTDAEPHPRTWRLLCEAYSLQLRCEDRAAAAALERRHAELVPAGGLLEGMRARRAALRVAGDPAAFACGVQLLRALCHLDLAAEGEALALELREEARHAPLRANSELRLLSLVCEARRRALPPLEHLANAESLAREFAELHGADHPWALLARFRATVAALDAWGMLGGRRAPSLPEVLARYEDLVPRMARHLGPGHIDTLKARTGLVMVRLNLAAADPSRPFPSGLLAETEELCAAFRARYPASHSRVVVAERTRLGALVQLGRRAEALEGRRALVDAYEAAGGLANKEAFDLRNEFADALLEAGLVDEARLRAARTLELLADAPLDEGVRCRARHATLLGLAHASLLSGLRGDLVARLDALAADATACVSLADFGGDESIGPEGELARPLALGRALLSGDEECAARLAASFAASPDASASSLAGPVGGFQMHCLLLHPAREGARLGPALEALARSMEQLGGTAWRRWQALERGAAAAPPLR
jgi:hypothetical protein